ncbi:aminodeoxychorismate/anthranilate synthase component II [soil metagenome]
MRNDQVTPEEIEARAPTHVLISPGPCTPLEAGISNDVIAHFAPKVPVLGVCLGHQCIGHTFGAEVVRADRIMHGKTSLIHHDGQGVYKGLPNPFVATRYHSLIIKAGTLPPEFDIVAWTEEGEIMGVRHKTYPLEGVQYHPESFLTTAGIDLLRNFIGR